jgi:hypothetical protein
MPLRRPPAYGADVDLSGGVAVRVSALCLDGDGRLTDRLLFSDAVRAGLLLDLALAGRLQPTAETIDVDEAPTGFEPADRLLAAMAAESGRSLDEWLGERRIGLRDVAAANVASGSWVRRTGPFGLRPRYTDRNRDRAERDAVRSTADWPEDATPADACVTVLAAASGLLDRDAGLPEGPPPAVLAAAAPVDWLCAVAAEHLQRAHRRYLDQASALGTGFF